MSDILPKLKTYVFISVVQLVINLVVWIFGTTPDLTGFINSTTTSFIPFIGLVNIYILGLPTEIGLIFGVFTGILSSIQTFILAMVVLLLVSNIIWHPDV